MALSRVRRSTDLSLSDYPSQRALNPNKAFTALTVREMTRLSLLCESTLARHAARMNHLPLPELPEAARFASLAVPEVAMAFRIRSFGMQTDVPLSSIDIPTSFPHGTDLFRPPCPRIHRLTRHPL